MTISTLSKNENEKANNNNLITYEMDYFHSNEVRIIFSVVIKISLIVEY